MAVFCDFENVALGVRDAKYAGLRHRQGAQRLLLRGSIVVKKAYCDWERYRDFKKDMHEASFELIEIPHVRMSGKNSATSAWSSMHSISATPISRRYIRHRQRRLGFLSAGLQAA